MTLDKDKMISDIQNRYRACLADGLLSENECSMMVAAWEMRRYTPAVFFTNGGDYYSMYTVTDTDGEVIGTYAAITAGRHAGKHETTVYAAGYNKRDINRLYKEYRI